MRFYTKTHQYYCGIDLHAKTMYACVMNQAGDVLVHRNIKTNQDCFLTLVSPYRDDLVVSVECIFTWYWLVDLCAREHIPFVLGHALYMKATHGGKVKNDKLDSHKIALLLKGGMLLQAYVYPAEMRPTRDLLRRRMHLSRQRAHLIAQSRIRCISIICRLWVCAWAFGEAAVLFLKGSPPAQQWLQKQTSRHGKGKALAILSKKLGQTVYAMLKKNRCFDEARFMAHLK